MSGRATGAYNMRWSWVSIDDMPTYRAALPASTWNGWECPSFPRDQVDLMIADHRRFRENDGEFVDELRWAADDPTVLEIVSCTYDAAGDVAGPGAFTPLVERMPAGQNGLYAVGAWAWCWSESDPPAVSLHKGHRIHERTA